MVTRKRKKLQPNSQAALPVFAQKSVILFPTDLLLALPAQGLLRLHSSESLGAPQGSQFLLITFTMHSTHQTRRMLPWLINFFSVLLALTSRSNGLCFCFSSCPAAPSTAPSIETFNIYCLLRMQFCHTGGSVWLLEGEHGHHLSPGSPAASCPKAAATLAASDHWVRAEKRPETASGSITGVSDRESGVLKVERDSGGRARPRNTTAQIQWPSPQPTLGRELEQLLSLALQRL